MSAYDGADPLGRYDCLHHCCKPPGCPGTHLSPEVAKQIHVKWRPLCRRVPFTCAKCGRRWKVYRGGWVPDE